MSQIYRKPHSYKNKKSIFKNRLFWLGALFFLVFGFIFYLLIFFDSFQIKGIRVEGAEKLSAGEIELLAEGYLEKSFLFFKTKSIFLIGKEEIKNQILAAFPLVGGIKVSRQWPATLKISIKEKIAVALWCENDACFELDETGIIFQAGEIDSALIKIESNQPGLVLGAKAVEAGLLMKILDINSKLKQEAGISIESVEIVSEDRLDFLTAEGWQAYFNLAGDLDWQITELALVLEKEISSAKRRNLEYIDLRYSKVYYK